MLRSHEAHFHGVCTGWNHHIFDAVEIEIPAFFYGVDEKVGELARLEEGENVMDGIAGLLGGTMSGSVLVDLLAQLAHGRLALGDVWQEGRLDMDHGGNQIILTF